MKTIKECIAYAYENIGKAELTGAPGYDYQPWTARVPFQDREPWNGRTIVKAGTRYGCTRVVNKSRFAVALWCWFDAWDNPHGMEAEEVKEIIESGFQNEACNLAWDWQKELRAAIGYLKAYRGYQDETE